MLITKLLILTLTLGLSAFTFEEIKASKGEEKSGADFLLILGCRVKGEKAEDTLEMRIAEGARYLLENKSTIAVCCGGIVHADQTISEAQAIKTGLISLGVPESRIILEDKSKTTRENFLFAKRIISGMNLESEPVLAFLSSDFHLLRAKKLAKQCGFSAFTVSAPSPKNKKAKNYLRELAVFPAVYLEPKN